MTVIWHTVSTSFVCATTRLARWGRSRHGSPSCNRSVVRRSPGAVAKAPRVQVGARIENVESVGQSQSCMSFVCCVAGTLGAVFVKRALVTALDFTAREFELTSVLLAALTPGMISAHDISAGFSELIFTLDDLVRALILYVNISRACLKIVCAGP